jgi:hypothetical protein
MVLTYPIIVLAMCIVLFEFNFNLDSFSKYLGLTNG